MLTRLAEEGDLMASGVAYAVITMPVLELVVVQIQRRTRTQESTLIGSLLIAIGHTSHLSHLSVIPHNVNLTSVFSCLYI